ncbi:MAG: sialate O-acetylesterase, partial [Rubripirellula sp.]
MLRISFAPRSWVVLGILITGTLNSLPNVHSDESETATPDVAIPSDPDNFHLFILAGQSNMAGRGKVSDADQKPIARVRSLGQDGNWYEATDPLHFDKPKMVGVGIGRSFAAEYIKHHPGVTVGLIPCAVGGSAIDTWQPGGFHSQTKT